jgi:hypothetical protein
MTPVSALIALVFRDGTEIEWKLSMTVGGVVGFAWFVSTFLSTLADLRKGDGIRAAKTPTFPAQSFVSGLCGIALLGSGWLIVALHREREPLWLQLFPIGFAGIAFCGWPRAIRCGDLEVSQKNLFGWKTRIPYASVEAISVDVAGTTRVIGAGRTIEHTAHHMDPVRFREIVSQRSGRPIY